jgi:hypothetical protein
LGQVTGSGTTDFVAKWTSSSAIGDSNIYSSGGLVGIGTTSPATKLEVNGGAQVDGNLTLSGSILSGSDVLIQSFGTGNFGAGLLALNPSATGTYNTAIGGSALYSNTTGYYNTACGYQALYSNTTSSGNTAVGYQALYSNTGLLNTAVGGDALQYNTGAQNTATGVEALGSNTTGGQNTANRTYALQYNTTGTGNTASGFEALFGATGSYNIAVGYAAGDNIGTGSNNLDIGNQGVSSDSGVIRIGTAGTQTAAYVAGIYGVTTSANNAVQVLIDSNGNLGAVSSSRRYKEDIHNMGDSSSGLLRLRPVTFRYKRPFEDGSKPIQYALIAEEVAEVYPDLVTRSADGQVETVKYQVLDAMLLSELQKQHATITDQKEQIRSLEERLARVEAAVGRTSLTASAH